MIQVLVIGQAVRGVAYAARVAAEHRLHLRVVAKAKAEAVQKGEDWMEVRETLVLSPSARQELENNPTFRRAMDLGRAFLASGRITKCDACGSHILGKEDCDA